MSAGSIETTSSSQLSSSAGRSVDGGGGTVLISSKDREASPAATTDAADVVPCFSTSRDLERRLGPALSSTGTKLTSGPKDADTGR